VVVKLAGHTDDRCLILTDVFPAMEYAGWNDDQTLISPSEHELVDAAEGGRSSPAVKADDAERAGCGEQAIDGKPMDAPSPYSPWKGGCNIHLNDGSFRKAPVSPKDFCQMTMMMRYGARETIADAFDRV
jgi:hypothetical protein